MNELRKFIIAFFQFKEIEITRSSRKKQEIEIIFDEKKYIIFLEQVK